MKRKNKRPRKLMRARNRDRVNRLRKQQTIILTPVFILVLIKVGLEDITTPLKMVERLMLHSNKLNGNLNFPITNPSFTDLKNMANDLADTIIAIEGGDKSLIPHRDTLMLLAENMIRKLSYDIQNQSNGDAEKIQSAGFEVRKGKGAPKPVGEVKNLTANALGAAKVKLRWKKIAYSRMNFIERTTDPVNVPWKPFAKTALSSFTVEGLTPGELVFYRVYGSNNLGDGNPSDPVEQRSL